MIEDDGYKLPNAQDLFAKLAQNGTAPKVYSVIDLAGAFNQLFLDEKSAALLVMNTNKGLLAPKPALFWGQNCAGPFSSDHGQDFVRNAKRILLH